MVIGSGRTSVWTAGALCETELLTEEVLSLLHSDPVLRLLGSKEHKLRDKYYSDSLFTMAMLACGTRKSWWIYFSKLTL